MTKRRGTSRSTIGPSACFMNRSVSRVTVACKLSTNPHVVLKQANADQVASDPVSYQLDRFLVRDLAEDPHHQDTDQQRDRRHRPDRVEGLKRPTDDVEDEGEDAVDRARDHRHRFDFRASTVNFRPLTMNFRLALLFQIEIARHRTQRGENRRGSVVRTAITRGKMRRRRTSAVVTGPPRGERTKAEGGFFHVADPVFGAVRCVPGFHLYEVVFSLSTRYTPIPSVSS